MAWSYQIKGQFCSLYKLSFSSIVLLDDYQVGLDVVVFNSTTQNQLECVTLPITADDVPEAPENLTVMFSSTDSEVTIDPTRNMATITIIDSREFYFRHPSKPR